MSNWELVGKPAVITSGVATYTFTPLDGDFDEEYKIEGSLDCAVSSSVRSLYLLINGATTNTGSSHIYKGNGGALTAEDLASIRLGTTNNADGCLKFEAKIDAKTGHVRNVNNHYSYYSATVYQFFGFSGGAWNDTSTKITSLGVQISSGTFTGTLYLYRRKVARKE